MAQPLRRARPALALASKARLCFAGKNLPLDPLAERLREHDQSQNLNQLSGLAANPHAPGS
jgi:hypothetical protein